MRIVIAPDSFKGSATALEVAENLAAGWRSARPGDDIVVLPMADGGEGTLDAFEAAVPGARRIPIVVDGPIGVPHQSSWVQLPDGTAVVELAATSGITLLRAPAPLDAHARGFGQAIVAALDAGATRLLLAIGGSASSDGGASVLTELGARLLNGDGGSIGLGNAGLAQLSTIDLSGLRALPGGGATVLADVSNPLLGSSGAVAVYGAQKGVDATNAPELESNLARFAALLGHDPRQPGAGAAGGVGYALLAWGAQFRSGAAAVGEVLGAAQIIASADVVITGEGRFDEQSARGKVPTYICELAAQHGTAAALVAGEIAARPRGFVSSVSLTELAGSTQLAGSTELACSTHQARAETARWLREAAAVIAAGIARST